MLSGRFFTVQNGISQNRKVAKFLQIELKQTEHERTHVDGEHAKMHLSNCSCTLYAGAKLPHTRFTLDDNKTATATVQRALISRDDHETGC